MKKIRENVFETNSSSTHSICIARSNNIQFPKKVHFAFGEFGWEIDTLSSVEEKASYLYTAMEQLSMGEEMETIETYLKEKDIEVSMEKKIEDDYWANGYVDHAGDGLGDLIRDVLEDKNKLYSYLFSPLSFILTGNDNDDHDVTIDVSYDHDEYYKGN